LMPLAKEGGSCSHRVEVSHTIESGNSNEQPAVFAINSYK
jgi:hypothetical protein